jgi:hypothetical protein
MVQYPCPTCQFTLANPRDFTPSSTRNACENYHQGNTPCCDMRQMPQNTGRTGRTGNQGHTTGAATVCKHDAGQVPQNTGRTSNQGHSTGAATVCKHDAACRDPNCRFAHPNGRVAFTSVGRQTRPDPCDGLMATNPTKPRNQGPTPPLCQHGWDCYSKVCWFDHPVGRVGPRGKPQGVMFVRHPQPQRVVIGAHPPSHRVVMGAHPPSHRVVMGAHPPQHHVVIGAHLPQHHVVIGGPTPPPAVAFGGRHPFGGLPYLG